MNNTTNNTTRSRGADLRLPIQVEPVDRTPAGTKVRKNVEGVSPSTWRQMACTAAAGSGSLACGPLADACYHILYDYCMGPGGL
jgi:hypothetical protein